MGDKNTVFHQNLSLNIGGNLRDLSKPKIMAILNLTPDSFYDGGKNTDPLKKAAEFLSQGADILDLGAYSSRPGAEHISEEEEQRRLIPVIRSILREFPEAILSVDTFRAGIARIAADSGAHIINDISGGGLDPEMFRTVAMLKLPYILMHMRGNPRTMVSETAYQNVTTEVCGYLAKKINELKDLGVNDVVIDPGFGFAKTPDQSYELLKNLDHLKIIGRPILVGLSRKSMIYKLLGTDASHALNATTVVNTIALLKGANILRVHDVKEAAEVIRIVEKVI